MTTAKDSANLIQRIVDKDASVFIGKHRGISAGQTGAVKQQSVKQNRLSGQVLVLWIRE